VTTLAFQNPHHQHRLDTEETANLCGGGTEFARHIVRLSNCIPVRMCAPKCCVYVLRSLRDPTRYYTGVTSDARLRLEAHNSVRKLFDGSGHCEDRGPDEDH
jgi:hypothetical protein